MLAHLYIIFFAISTTLAHPLFGKHRFAKFNLTVPLVSPHFQNSSYINASSIVLFSNTSSLDSTETKSITVTTTIEQSSSASDTTEIPITTEVSTTSSASSETTSSTSTSASGAVQTGRGTWYEVGNDNCGTSSTNEDLVCAIAKTLYDSNANSDSVSEYCGKTITATYQNKNVVVKVVDSCESCSESDLDFSPAAFKELASLDTGEIEIEWSWN